MSQWLYINGFPGVGKLTVAKELQKLVPNSKVYHNHLFIDPIAAVVDRSSPHYNAMRSVILSCDLEENLRRIVSVDRRIGSTKLLDSDLLQDIRRREQVFQLRDERELSLDITNLSPEQAALVIWEHVKEVGPLVGASRL